MLQTEQSAHLDYSNASLRLENFPNASLELCWLCV